jgi:glycosyltransferase involved in cell wall biosynthesis
MIKYSIVIPTFGRNKFLGGCLESINKQTIKPEQVIIIDNNYNAEYRGSVQKIIKENSINDIKYSYNKGRINSGAVARNHGASLVNTDLVAFLDDDVVLDDDYYEKVINVFKLDDNIVGVQGLDRALAENYSINIRNKFFGKTLLAIENFLEQAFIVKDKDSSLRPSLAVSHPIPDLEFYEESQWISTCAGVFKTDLFKIIEFPKQFVKYSWNEYVFFSHNIYKMQLGKMIYTSEPKYRNMPTDDGRLPIKELVYMAEVYDLYVFNNLFNRNFRDRAIYFKSRLSRLLIYFWRTIRTRQYKLTLLRNAFGAMYFTFKNRNEIKKGNLECYNKLFPLE